MKISKFAVITDTHGNLPALRAALDAIRVEKCDAIFHLGDAIAIGPHSGECLDLLLNTPNLTCIIGNHEESCFQGIPKPKQARMSAEEVRHQKWVHQQLGEERKQTLSTWKSVIACEIQGTRVHFQHYGFSDTEESFAKIIREPSAQDLDKLFADVEADVVFYGHAHGASDVKGSKHYINPGSLGCNPQSVAKYTIAEFKNGIMYLDHLEVHYDDKELYEAFEEREVPDREFIYQVFFGGRFKKYET